MSIDTSKSFLKALQNINESTLSDNIQWKIDHIKDAHERNQKLQSIGEEIKKLNDDFKNEHYDSMTKLKYRRFRADYQTKRNTILCKKDKELNNLEYRYNIEFNKLNLISDDDKRQRLKTELKQKNSKVRNDINIKYDKIMHEFKINYRYNMTQMGLTWRYIVNDGLEI